GAVGPEPGNRDLLGRRMVDHFVDLLRLVMETGARLLRVCRRPSDVALGCAGQGEGLNGRSPERLHRRLTRSGRLPGARPLRRGVRWKILEVTFVATIIHRGREQRGAHSSAIVDRQLRETWRN